MSIQTAVPKKKQDTRPLASWMPSETRTNHVPKASLLVGGLLKSKHPFWFITIPRGTATNSHPSFRYWLNAIKTTPASFQRRFIDSFQRYVDSVVEQSSDRDHHCQRDIQSYLTLRRFTIGAEPSFVLNAMHMDLPDHVVSHATLKRLEQLATDMIILGNDIVSYDRE